MKTTMNRLMVLMVLVLSSNVADADVSVRGYFRRNGTYVQPHHRSSPDGIITNNWSHCGNINPHTGEVGRKNCGVQSQTEMGLPHTPKEAADQKAENAPSAGKRRASVLPSDDQEFLVWLKCHSVVSSFNAPVILHNKMERSLACVIRNTELHCVISQNKPVKMLGILLFTIDSRKPVLTASTPLNRGSIYMTATNPSSGETPLGVVNYGHHWTQKIDGEWFSFTQACNGVWSP